MQRVLVIDKSKNPLMPCHPARARGLLAQRKAVVYNFKPFTIMLIDRVGGEKQVVELKFDPGSKVTGIAAVIVGKHGRQVVWAAHLQHRGQAIQSALLARRALRRSRRNRHCRYRAPRFLNRVRQPGWLPPSIQSRVNNITSWVRKLISFIPITKLYTESVRFDMQALKNPEIEGVQYQRGTLFGFEVREYLLEKWQRTCAYCQVKDVPLEIDHVVARSCGGTDKVSNLVLACRNCNEKKGNRSLTDFLKNNSDRLSKIKQQLISPLKDAAAVNASRYAIVDALHVFNLPVGKASGGRTKYNRVQQKYTKAHWIDAACVGETGNQIKLNLTWQALEIKACGRGTRQVCRVNRFGFPRTSAKTKKLVQGFKTGDLVKALVTKGKKIGKYFGKVAIRASGNFNIATQNGIIQGINWRYCQLIQRTDGYMYT